MEKLTTHKMPDGFYYLIGNKKCTELECKESGCSFPDCHDVYAVLPNEDQANDLAQLFNNHLSSIKTLMVENDELNAENNKLMSLLQMIESMGFLTPSADSSVTHREICRIYESVKL